MATVRQAIHDNMRIGCTGCGYCMPCPFGVKIPRNFKAWNLGALTENYDKEWSRYTDSEEGRATLCMQCGHCESVCPQHLPIIESLQIMHNEIMSYFENKK